MQHPKTGRWRCFSTIVDDWVTSWMSEADYEIWRQEQYGINCGPLSGANKMTLEEAKEKIRIREIEEQV